MAQVVSAGTTGTILNLDGVIMVMDGFGDDAIAAVT